MNKNLIYKIVLILLFILVILILAIQIMSKINDKKNENKSVHDLENILSYSNSVNDVYKGSIDTYKIYNKIQILFETFLPSISDEIMNKTEDELKKYFDNDSERIYNNIGISSKEEFVDFATKIQKIDSGLDTFNQLTYLENSYQNIGDEETIELKVTYDNGKELDCKLHILKKGNNEVFTKFELLDK